MSVASDPEIRELVQKVATEAASKAARDTVIQTLLLLGLNVSDPDAILETQGHVRFLKEMHDGSDTMKRAVRTSVIGSCATGLFALLYWGFTSFVSKVH